MKKIKEKSGETLTEVLVSMFIFLLMLGILQGAISYSSASLHKYEQMRQNQTQVLQGLLSASAVEGEQNAISFRATDLKSLGEIVFEVPTAFDSKLVQYTDEDGKQKTVTFCIYAYREQITHPTSENGGAS